MTNRLKFLLVILWFCIMGLVASLWSTADAASLEITWNANTETDLAGYNVFYKPTTATVWTKTTVGKITKWTIDTGILENVEYCAQVSAFDLKANESGLSVTSCDNLDTIPPTTPTGVRARVLKIIAWLKSLFG